MTPSVWISIASVLIAAVSAVDLLLRRRRQKIKEASEGDVAIVTSAVELVETYRVKVRELTTEVGELRMRIKRMTQDLADANHEVATLRQQIKDMTDHIGD